MPWAFSLLQHIFISVYLCSHKWTEMSFSETVIKKWHQHTPKEAHSTLSWRGWPSTQRLSVVFRVQRLIIKFALLTLKTCMAPFVFSTKEICRNRQGNRWGESKIENRRDPVFLVRSLICCGLLIFLLSALPVRPQHAQSGCWACFMHASSRIMSN